MSFLALDLGTSFIKGAILDLNTLRISHVHRIPFPAPLSDQLPWRCEIDPRQVVSAAQDVIEHLLPHTPNCSGMVMCGQMQGLVLTDEHGEPLSNCISWQDQRALLPHPSGEGTFFDVLSRQSTPKEHRQMGSELRPGLPACALFWLVEQNQLPHAIPASLPDFVVANLCRTLATTEPTNASVHGVFNLETGDWHWPVISRLGLKSLRWPEIRRTGQVVGHLNAGSRSIPCYTPVGDQPCALVGALLQDGELSINISTGSQVSLLSHRLEMGDYQTRPFFDGKYLNLITHIPAGRSLNTLVNLLTELAQKQGFELDPWPHIVRAVEQVSKTDLRVNLAFFAGACGDQGEIANIQESNLTIGHLFRAAFENMADNYYACALRLSPRRAWRRLVFSGGLAQKVEPLRRIICDRFGDEYRIAPSSEDSLTGLLALALAFGGRAESVERAIAQVSAR